MEEGYKDLVVRSVGLGFWTSVDFLLGNRHTHYSLLTSCSVFFSSDYYQWNSTLQDMKIPGLLRIEGMSSSPLGSTSTHAM